VRGDSRTDADLVAEAIRAIYPYNHPSVSTLARHLSIGTPRMQRVIEQSPRLFTKQGADILRFERAGGDPYIAGLHGDRFLVQEYSHYLYLWS
jgi:hypothetical protein